MNQSHSTSNSPALSAGGPQGGGLPPGGGGGYLPGPHPSQPQHQAAGRQDMPPQLVYMQPGSSVQYRPSLQQAQYLQSFNPLMQRPTMMNSQLPQQQQQQQQQMLHQQQQQQQQQQQFVAQMRPPPMVAGPRYPGTLPHFPSPSQTGYMQPQQDQAMYHQVISPPEHLGYMQNIHPAFYPHLQMQQQVQQRPEASSQVFGGGQIQPNAQPWQVYQQGGNVAQFYQPVAPARYQQPVARHMMPTMQPNVGIQPQEMTGENAVTISQMTVPDTIQPRQSFVPRNNGTVYYDPNAKPESEDRGHTTRPPARRAIAIIDPDTGKNVLESLDSSQRPTSDEALQIQSEFSKKVTQRIALGDKAYDQHDFTVAQPGHFAGSQPKSAKPLVEKEAGDQPESGISAAPTAIAETFAKPEAVKTEEALGDAEKCLPAVNLGIKEEVDLVLQTESMDSTMISLPVENSSLVCKMEEEEKEEVEEEVAEVHEVKVREEEQSVTDPEDIQEEREEEKVVAFPVEEQTVYTECKEENVESECAEENTGVQVTESVSSKEFVPESEPGKDGSPIREVKETEGGDAVEPQLGTTTAEKEDLESHNGDDGASSKTEDDAVSEAGDSRSKYSYEPGQWSPLNPDGKKVYGRDFLLQLQYIPESTQTPPGLPNLPEIIRSSMPPRDSAREHSFPSLPVNSSIDFMPRYAHERASVGKVPIKRNSFQKRSDPPVKIITIQRSEDVRLHKTEQAWKPAAISKDEPLDPEMSKTEELYKKVRGILNKITPSTFDRLINQVTELPIDNENRLSGCIKILFEKAISEPKFVKAYSNMAHRLSSHNVQCDDNPDKKVSFRKLLLNRCQEEFEKDKEDELDIERREKEIEETATGDKKKLLIEAKEQAIMKSRRRSLGNIRFIGELFKLKMLTEAIMHDCVKKLLNADDEDSLELLCNLLTTIGKELDTEKARRSMDSYFTKLSSKKGLPPRIRFMIQDLFELRENKWVPRRAENIPKTIDQIHREAHEEKELAKQQMLARPSLPPPKSRGRPAGLTSSLEKGTDDGWSVPIGAKHRIDANKMLKIAKSMKDEVTLAPQFAPSWQKGSSGIGSRGSSQEGEKPLMPTNRYTALENLATSGSEVSERSSRFSAVTRNSLQTASRHLPESSSDSRMFLSVSQDRSRNASQDRSEGESNPNQPQGAVSVPSLTAIDREPEKQPQPTAAEELSKEEIERKATTILDEYFGVEDLKEAFMCVEELRSPNSLHVFVSFAINYVLEKKQHIMNLAGTLLNELLNKGVLDTEQFEKGLKDILEDAESLAVDIPRFWEYLGDILASTISCHHQLWQLLRVACDELASCGKSENLFRRTIDAISIKVGSDKTCDALRKSGLRWSSYVNEGLFSYARQHNLEHLDPVREELIALMKQNSDNQPLFEWIQKNVSESEAESREFIRALVTAVCSCALTASDNATSENIVYVVSEDQILQRTPLLQRYLDHKPDREIQALYALQALMHSREHPRNTLHTFFEILYDKEIIAEEAFWDWKDSSDPAEQTGRGVALQSVRAFFDWLNEAAEEQTGS